MFTSNEEKRLRKIIHEEIQFYFIRMLNKMEEK